MEISPIAHIQNDYTDKFAIPRQSGLTCILSTIVFEAPYNDPNAVRGLEGFSHIWLIWGFSKSIREQPALTVRPPRLGGNERVGVFASRSPFRPNHLGLSCVKLEQIEQQNGSVTLTVSGADLMNGTPIYDIKPYVPYSDSVPDAAGGFTQSTDFPTLEVIFPDELRAPLTDAQQQALCEILKQDPRPAYQEDESRIYGFRFAEHEIKFKVKDSTLTVVAVE